MENGSANRLRDRYDIPPSAPESGLEEIVFQFFDGAQGADLNARYERLEAFRSAMKRAGIDAYIVPRSDAHQGEYVADCDERLAWLFGFTGSAGFGLITADKAAVLVDGRYTLQAAQQVATEKVEVVDFPSTQPEDWLAEALNAGATVGADPWLTTVAQQRRFSATLKSAGVKLRLRTGNLVDRCWGKLRPEPPSETIVAHPKKYAGRSAADKVITVQKTLADHGADAAVLTQPDSICWLLNLRGSDIVHTPVFQAFAVVPATGPVVVFADPERLTKQALQSLGRAAVFQSPDALKTVLADLNQSDKAIWFDPTVTPVAIAQQISKARKIERRDPCVLPRAIKNATEIAGAKAAHHRDAIAVVRFLAWFDNTVAKQPPTEIEAAQALEAFRRETGQLKEISFDTISGSGPNGAIVHYRVTFDTDRRLGKGEFFLLDSGAQYLDGTTDITRTIAVGRPTKEMRTRLTQVLKGHIAIATARFPVGTRGIDLDPFARHALWQAGVDYDHGTGHGIGSYLSVHEGPQSISKRGMQELHPGMIISNEPGYYKTGAYGIRLENLVLVQEPDVPDGGDREMLSFETLTLVPFDRNAIDKSLLYDGELTWLNGYHASVYSALQSELDPTTRTWLKAACAKI